MIWVSIISCSIKIQNNFAILVPVYPRCPGILAIKRQCVCVCACGRRLTSTFVDGESAFIILISMVWGVASFDKINVNIQSAIVLNILHNKHCNIYYHSLTGTCYLTMTLPWKNSTMFHTDIPTCHSYYCTDLHCPLIMSNSFLAYRLTVYNVIERKHTTLVLGKTLANVTKQQ